jgi:hypothetical protein
VLPIWEGTTNILSLDFVNDIFKNYTLNIDILKDLLTVKIPEPRVDSILTQEKIKILEKYSL